MDLEEPSPTRNISNGYSITMESIMEKQDNQSPFFIIIFQLLSTYKKTKKYSLALV